MNVHAAQVLGACGLGGPGAPDRGDAARAAYRRPRRLGGGWAGLAVYLAPHGHHRLLAAAAVVGSIAAAVGAALVVRVPWLLALATLACVPARFPVHVGSTKANLLLPIYGVVVVAALALAWELFGDGVAAGRSDRSRGRSRSSSPGSGLTFLWTKDVRQGAIELASSCSRSGCSRSSSHGCRGRAPWVLTLYVQLAFMGLLFALIGLVAVPVAEHLLEPEGEVDNAYAPSGWFYRVNSVFYDPSIYGRFLVVAILASLAVILLRRGDPLWQIAAALVIVITWAGLLPSFSQSSFAR